MQEDNLSKWLAEQLRKQQEENQLPYELGAWEAFEAKRKAAAGKKPNYWISGIAAAITVLMVAGGIWLAQDTDSVIGPGVDQLALENPSAESPVQKLTPQLADVEAPEAADQPVSNLEEAAESNNSTSKSSVSVLPRKSALWPIDPPASSTALDVRAISESSNLAVAKESIQEELTSKAAGGNSLIASSLTPAQESVGTQPAKKEETSGSELPKDPQLSDEEIEAILQRKSFATIAMGLSPGLGSSHSSDQTTAGTSLGLGVMVDMAITGKLIMGSGLAVNYLNQASESQSYNYAGINAAASSVTETNEINQVQLDIPLYFKYPITRNEKISVQAGFSNLITFNQGAEQESSYTRQVAVYDATAASGFTLKSESVNQNQDLNVSSQQFYPFATANLGVNIRLFDAKKTSYEVMPFYNYPLQEFSGYGEKLGMFGASFKVNFGAVKGK